MLDEYTLVTFNYNCIQEIDTAILPLVKAFNGIGLITQFCCIGHKEWEPTSIIFDKQVSPQMIEDFLRNYPVQSLFSFYQWTRLDSIYTDDFAYSMVVDNNAPLLKNFICEGHLPMEERVEFVKGYAQEILSRHYQMHLDQSFTGCRAIFTKEMPFTSVCPYCKSELSFTSKYFPVVKKTQCGHCGKTANIIRIEFYS